MKGEGGIECKGWSVNRDNEVKIVTRVNLGCGHQLFTDCVNVDMSHDVKPDLMWDFTKRPWPFPNDTFSSAYCSHLIEHLRDPLAFMEELARVCAPGAVAVFRVPYGSSDNAWEDPTHVRPYFLDSFGYFSQAAYGGADYGYRGDWTCVKREFIIREGRGFEQYAEDLESLLALIMVQRNVVDEFRVALRNVKPIRDPIIAREASAINFVFPSMKVALKEVKK
jgi:SAM-dependent methyltransferase